MPLRGGSPCVWVSVVKPVGQRTGMRRKCFSLNPATLYLVPERWEPGACWTLGQDDAPGGVCPGTIREVWRWQRGGKMKAGTQSYAFGGIEVGVGSTVYAHPHAGPTAGE